MGKVSYVQSVETLDLFEGTARSLFEPHQTRVDRVLRSERQVPVIGRVT